MDNVVDIADIRFTQKRRRPTQDGCPHRHLSLIPDGEYVMCDDCDKQISTFYALAQLVEQWARAKHNHEQRERRIRDAEERTLSLRAAQKVEDAWRRRKMVPACPHCRKPIFATDGFGESLVNREIAQRMRAVDSMGERP